MKTGVCYYPEHWPEEQWAHDAAHMRKLGLSVIRIGEFAWSRLETQDGKLHLDWLERAIDTLHEAGLSVVLGTPTATPPRWMLDRHPDMLAVDADGRIRDFGSRRHYCFSHEPYLDECRRIVTLLAERFGQHPAIMAWQTDNEYGCHSTSISYSPHALAAFQRWCATQYADVEALNLAWGNVFWSMEYDNFEQIGLPVGTVTESNPAHQLAFWRFSSDQIKRFNRAQVDIIRKHSPGRDVLHNFMGNFVEFDHHDVSTDLDIATWDNYPLGFLTRDNGDADDQQAFLRTGHPDGSAFHHDLYRGCCNGRWWVMEQQPGPVNWAPYNPSPVDGMVRLWGWEAYAHGAEVMSYFRWRQAPFAQEQTHTGLLLSNGDADVAASEVATLNRELAEVAAFDVGELMRSDTPVSESPNVAESLKSLPVHSDVAIVFSYAGIAIQDIQLPGGSSYSPLGFCQRVHSACRQWGVNVDIVSPAASLDQYRLVLVCTSTEDEDDLVKRLQSAHKQHQAVIALFPGTGSRSHDYTMPDNLPPGYFQQLLPLQIIRSESLPAEQSMTATDSHGLSRSCSQWRERIASSIEPRMSFGDGWGFHYEQDHIHYINAIPEKNALIPMIGELLVEAGIPCRELGAYLRTQRIGPYQLAFNFGKQAVELDKALGTVLNFHHDTPLLVGSRTLGQAEVAVWVAG
ncbi:beta-galactosidase [Granulosicoccus antarcticus]|uniref:Beta-galactosidase n=1 Tax=Granulosicoccus antarcticus IMCC3135 TaxID=1192854 RepID=A0A2Z2NVX5_9GAMM|nr:beta-galactosidase [Granulosicoccus antarcticus]ASJ75616.1 Beta-galactosidase [Granulosicoccus antarcticus IMCC3135]